jgi:hypothetical protein
MASSLVVISQDYELVEKKRFSDEESAKAGLVERFNKERSAMLENEENIIEDDILFDGLSARLFYEDNDEVLGYAMYVI